MSKKLKDTDYLSISTRVRAMENRLLTREAEITAIRTILSGRMAGLSADIIRERLRDAYV